MNDLRWNSISGSIGDVGRQIAGVDERLADFFGRIAEIIGEIQREHVAEIFPNNIGREITDRINRGKRINTFPFGERNGCLEECLVITFGILNRKYGFNQVVEEVKNYWYKCSRENCRTLIVTNAWDIADFNRRHKDAFDSYTSSENKNNIKHTVVIVLLGKYGFSVQYLR
jgi:hypothetical protein